MNTTTTYRDLADHIVTRAVVNMNKRPGRTSPNTIDAVNRAVRLVEEFGPHARPAIEGLRASCANILNEARDNGEHGHEETAIAHAAYIAVLVLLDEALNESHRSH